MLLVTCNDTEDNFFMGAPKNKFQFHRNLESTGKLIMYKISLHKNLIFEVISYNLLHLISPYEV